MATLSKFAFLSLQNLFKTKCVRQTHVLNERQDENAPEC